jgi:hypothetical protein
MYLCSSRKKSSVASQGTLFSCPFPFLYQGVPLQQQHHFLSSLFFFVFLFRLMSGSPSCLHACLIRPFLQPLFLLLLPQQPEQVSPVR